MALVNIALGCWLLHCMQIVCCTQRSVYKDIAIGMNWQNFVMGSNVDGTHKRLVDLMSSGHGVRLSFATGECGDEKWADGRVSADNFAQANIRLLNSYGIQYTVSTGGAKGIFTCSSTSGADSFLKRYMGSQLQGLDFDIERDMSTDQLSNLMNNILYLQQKNPKLIISFTLATIASTSGDAACINETLGKFVLSAAANAGLRYVVNLMVMNYGEKPSNWICVVDRGNCDMGASAIQAAKNLNKKYGVPFTNIALTPMIGMNDITNEIFTIDDMKRVKKFSAKARLAGLHYWSFDRDRQCPTPAISVSPTCSGVEHEPLEYYGLLRHDHTDL